MVQPLVRLSQVSKEYDERVVVDSLNLDINRGDCVVLTGHNGAGKSSLLRMIAGRERPTRGSILFKGQPLTEDDVAIRRHVSYVGDDIGVYPDLTVQEHLLLAAVAHGLANQAEETVMAVLSECGLDAHASFTPRALSSGLFQKFRLAASLVRPRRLLVLDEPEQRLDANALKWLVALLGRELVGGTSLVIASHDQGVASLAGRVISLADGRVQEEAHQRLCPG